MYIVYDSIQRNIVVWISNIQDVSHSEVNRKTLNRFRQDKKKEKKNSQVCMVGYALFPRYHYSKSHGKRKMNLLWNGCNSHNPWWNPTNNGLLKKKKNKTEEESNYALITRTFRKTDFQVALHLQRNWVIITAKLTVFENSFSKSF